MKTIHLLGSRVIRYTQVDVAFPYVSIVVEWHLYLDDDASAISLTKRDLA